MNLLASSHLWQFGFNPAVGGMRLPDPAGSGTRTVSPGVSADLYAFAAINRTLRCEAEHGPKSPFVQVHNSAKTVLADPDSSHQYVESLFQYLRDDGFIDRSVDLRENRDLRASHYLAGTVIGHSVVTDGQKTNSSIAKSVLGLRRPDGVEDLKDHWLTMHLTGRTLKDIASHPDYLDLQGYDRTTLAVLFSAFVYFSDDPLEGLGDGIYLVDSEDRLHRILHEGSQNFHEALGIVNRVASGNRVRVVSRPPNREKPVSFDNKPVIDIEVAPKWEVFGEEDEMHLEMKITPGPDGNPIALQGGLLGIAQFILGSSAP